jgi:hypothetical protein
MGRRHGAIEELHQVRRWALLGEQLEKDLECARPAQPPEPFPDAVPFAELGRDGPPTEVVNGEKKISASKNLRSLCPGSPRLGRAARKTSSTSSQSCSVSFDSMSGLLCRSRSDSMKCRFGNLSNMHIKDSVHTA